ncbi:hypothetical protein BDZ89DRAFT_1143160 [Hymenopellis radicata]|nr:hypothetical protein BDZ89DRAFT_1143160 [Hymenopellis radicata]
MDAQETARDLTAITPLPPTMAGFDMVWGHVVCALILDRPNDLPMTPKPTNGVGIILEDGHERVTLSPKCDFGCESGNILVLAGDIDSSVGGDDKYRSLLRNLCVMKSARIAGKESRNLQLMNVFIRHKHQENGRFVSGHLCVSVEMPERSETFRDVTSPRDAHLAPGDDPCL